MIQRSGNSRRNWYSPLCQLETSTPHFHDLIDEASRKSIKTELTWMALSVNLISLTFLKQSPETEKYTFFSSVPVTYIKEYHVHSKEHTYTLREQQPNNTCSLDHNEWNRKPLTKRWRVLLFRSLSNVLPSNTWMKKSRDILKINQKWKYN